MPPSSPINNLFFSTFFLLDLSPNLLLPKNYMVRILHEISSHGRYFTNYHHMADTFWTIIIWQILYELLLHGRYFTNYHHMADTLWTIVTWQILYEISSHGRYFTNCHHMVDTFWTIITWQILYELSSHGRHFTNHHHMAEFPSTQQFAVGWFYGRMPDWNCNQNLSVQLIHTNYIKLSNY
jgi:hypothetical protein